MQSSTDFLKLLNHQLLCPQMTKVGKALLEQVKVEKNILFGTGLCSPLGLPSCDFVPFDMLSFFVIAPWLAKELCLNYIIYFIGDREALKANPQFSEKKIDKINKLAQQHKAFFIKFAEVTKITNYKVFLSSEISEDPLYLQIEKEAARITQSKKKPYIYEIVEAVDIEFFRRKYNVVLKLSWGDSDPDVPDIFGNSRIENIIANKESTQDSSSKEANNYNSEDKNEFEENLEEQFQSRFSSLLETPQPNLSSNLSTFFQTPQLHPNPRCFENKETFEEIKLDGNETEPAPHSLQKMVLNEKYFDKFYCNLFHDQEMSFVYCQPGKEKPNKKKCPYICLEEEVKNRLVIGDDLETIQTKLTSGSKNQKFQEKYWMLISSFKEMFSNILTDPQSSKQKKTKKEALNFKYESLSLNLYEISSILLK